MPSIGKLFNCCWPIIIFHLLLNFLSLIFQIDKFERMIPFYDMCYDDFARTFPNWEYTYMSEKVISFCHQPQLDPRMIKGFDEYHMYVDGTKDENDPKEPWAKFA